MSKESYIVVAVDQQFGIGKDGTLPWRLDSELKYFKMRTSQVDDPGKQNAVIMGRATWESIPAKNRPLPNRKNYVLTRNPEYKAEGAAVFHDLDTALKDAEADPTIEKIFIIGGAQLFEHAIAHVDGIYLTEIKSTFDCDTFFPEIPEYFEEVKVLGDGQEDGIHFDYLLYLNKDND